MTAPLFAIKAVCQYPAPSQHFFHLGIFCIRYPVAIMVNIDTANMVQTLTLKMFFEIQISLYFLLILVLSLLAILSALS